MKRIPILLAMTAFVVFATSGVAGAKHSATLKLSTTSKGKILVSSSGFTLYMFTRDVRNKDRCAMISGCAGVWPALTVKGKPTAGPGVRRSLLGTIKLAHGVRQVTYAGRPLYTYAFDGGPGATSYIGANQFGGNWFALTAGGRKVR
jgi:predicted lipoprotein with Yx(FWY)xxD motif